MHSEFTYPHKPVADILRDLMRIGMAGEAQLAAEAYGVLVEEMLGRRRFILLSHARQSFWVTLRERGYSYPMIARLVGRDHTTVVAGVKAHAARLRAYLAA